MVTSLVLSVLAFILLDRLHYYQEWAEKANMEYTVASLKSALRFKVSKLMIEGRIRECVALARQNPVEWMDSRPANYMGEFDGSPPDMLSHGGWFYDRTSQELVYQLNQGRYFLPDSRGRQQVRYRLTVVYDKIQDKEVGYSLMLPSGVRLETVEAYRWF